MSKHTKQQIKNWRAFEDVRAGGQFNMYDPNARALTGLEKVDYRYCMDNYDTLKEQAKG